MEVKELRIGNLVSYLGEKHEVIGTHFLSKYIELWRFGIVNQINIKEIKPIKLTDEWLLRFGFEQNENLFIYYFGFYSIKINHDDSGFNFCHDDGFANIEYVHMLQNMLFALTGEELYEK